MLMYFERKKKMKYVENGVTDLKIAYIGGGSRGWAWGLMADLAAETSLSGSVYLYDIDEKAAKDNETVGNSISKTHPEVSQNFTYIATKTLEEALRGADFVVISILPGTFEEMASDVHTPEKYGIYQSVGDTVGPGGVIRALRTIPMFEVIASAIRDYCPEAWVINYTNPMSVCVRTLYRVFPQIKAFGCCHEVFGTQKILAKALEEFGYGDNISREEIKVNVVGINHFTWITKAYYRSTDILPIYESFCRKHREEGLPQVDVNWRNRSFVSKERVKMDLFLRYGYIAAAGDRHLAEFCPGDWYLKDPETVEAWGFGLTSVDWRKADLKDRLAKSADYVSGKLPFELKETGEEGVKQMKAILGLGDLVTNVNLPNIGQIPNLPFGAVVETNAHFTSGRVTPVAAGEMPGTIAALTYPTLQNQECVVEAGLTRDLELAFRAFVSDHLVTVDHGTARKLFDTMVENTKAYLTMYFPTEERSI